MCSSLVVHLCLRFVYCRRLSAQCSFFFFFNDTATTEIYTLSLHDALPICAAGQRRHAGLAAADDAVAAAAGPRAQLRADRKSTRLNSSHLVISYAVFCLKKKNRNRTPE